MLNSINVRKVIDRAPFLTRIGFYYYGFDSWTSSIFRVAPADIDLDGNPRMFIDSDGNFFDRRTFVQHVGGGSQ